jgi:drug/metabolite transporter (DMT)-like permease
VVAALGQGLGAVVSRKAYLVVELSGGHVDGLSAAYQRILGGLLFAVPVSGFWLARRGPRIHLSQSAPPKPSQAASTLENRITPEPASNGKAARAPRPKPGTPTWVWVLLNALAGPALGVGCYQWALATTPSAVVLPIVATMPILLIPLAWWMEGDRPSRRSVIGGAIAVGGAVWMAA